MRYLLWELWCGWFLESHSTYTCYRFLNLTYIMHKDRVDPNSQICGKFICLAAYKTFISIFVPSLDQDKIMLQSPGISNLKKWNQQLTLCMESRIIKNYRGKSQYLELALDLVHRSTEAMGRWEEGSEFWQRSYVFSETKDLDMMRGTKIFMNYLCSSLLTPERNSLSAWLLVIYN